jgi:ketosteroid isomerase-like protein
VGLLFQPRRATSWPPPHVPLPLVEPALDRRRVLVAALEAIIRGDASRFDDLFSHDIEFCGPHVSLRSRRALQRHLGTPEDSLTDLDIVVLAVDAIADKVIAEWRLDAMFTRPVLFDDRQLIEPTGDAVHLAGASVAEFRGRRICAFRNYFDDSELLAGVPESARARYPSPR